LIEINVLWWVAVVMTVCFVILFIVCLWTVATLPKNPNDVSMAIGLVLIVFLVSLCLPSLWQIVLATNMQQTCLVGPPEIGAICLD